jgi:hypothetical protein
MIRQAKRKTWILPTPSSRSNLQLVVFDFLDKAGLSAAVKRE